MTARGTQAERLPLRSFTTANGLAHDYVYMVRQDAHGFVWLGTDVGVSRYDGTSFRNFGPSDGLPSSWVADVLETRDGALLFATGAGICQTAGADPATPARAPHRTFACERLDRPETANDVRELHQDRSGVVWAATRAGLYRGERRAERWHFARVPLGLEPGTALHDEPLRAIAEAADGSLWLATAVGVAHHHPGGSTQRFAVCDCRADDRVFALRFDRGGRLWIGHVDAGLFIWKPPTDDGAIGAPLERLARRRDAPLGRFTLPDRAGELVHVDHRDGLPDDRVRTGLVEDLDGGMWVGTVRALAHLAGGTITAYGPENGLPGDGTRPSLVDRAGNVWFGSPSGGAARLRRGGLLSYDRADGLRGTRVRSVLEGPDGAVYVLSSGERDYVQRFDGARFAAATPALPPGYAYTGWWNGQTGLQDRQGDWWIPGGGAGLLRYRAVRALADLEDARRRRGYGTGDGLGCLDAQLVYESRAGDLWMASFCSPSLSVRRHGSDRFESFAEGAPTGLPHEVPLAFAEDAAGALWIGFGDGTLGRFAHGRLLPVPRGALPGVRRIFGLHFDAGGRLWVASADGGLVRLDDPTAPSPRSHAYGMADGLASNEVTCVVGDGLGRLYLCGGQGVDRLDPATGTVARFTTADGLANNIVTSGLRDRHGNLWFGTLQGLSRLQPDADRSLPVPTALITGVELGGVPQPLDDAGALRPAGVRLTTGSDRLRVTFVAPSADLDVEPAYRYRLEGLEPEWSAPTRDHALTYAQLAPGRYRFAVHAVRPDGSAGRAAAFDLVVLPPLWRRWWALLAYAALVLGAVVGLHRERVARLLAVQRVRARIAADLHDDLGASLSRIAVLSEVASRKAGQEVVPELRQIADTARQLTDDASDMVWSIDPQHDDLANLLVRVRRLAADLLGERGIALEWNAPPTAAAVHLSADQRRHLMLLLKEALHNAARHGAARTVALTVACNERCLFAEVRDDGAGFDPARPPEPAHPRGGRGLRSLRARARELGATLDIRSAPGAGTRVRLSMPRRPGA